MVVSYGKVPCVHYVALKRAIEAVVWSRLPQYDCSLDWLFLTETSVRSDTFVQKNLHYKTSVRYAEPFLGRTTLRQSPFSVTQVFTSLIVPSHSSTNVTRFSLTIVHWMSSPPDEDRLTFIRSISRHMRPNGASAASLESARLAGFPTTFPAC